MVRKDPYQVSSRPECLCTIITQSGDELLSSETIYESGPYGSMKGGEWFTDFWQSLDGFDFNPKHWPDGINVRHGERIDR